MAVLKLHYLPDPVLRRKAKRVRTIDASIKKLAVDMLETMHAIEGVGLAAPQVGVSLRIIVLGMPEEEDVVIVNPVIVKKGGERTIVERCLSVPGYYGEVKRAESVTVKGRSLEGKEIRIKADDILAQALEHEIDHLNGMLYVDHLDDMEKLKKAGQREANEAEEAEE